MAFLEMQRYDKKTTWQNIILSFAKMFVPLHPISQGNQRSVILALLIEYKVDIHVPPAEADAVLPSEESKQIPHTAPGGLVWG